MQIKTGHLTVRNFKEEDLRDKFEYLSDKKVMWFVEEPYEYTQAHNFIREYGLREKPLIYVLIGNSSNRIIGHIIFHPYEDERIYELGCIIGKEAQGKGYGYEISQALLEYGFEKLKLHKIVAETVEGNVKALALIKKLGMKKEGVFRKQCCVHGEWVDKYFFGIFPNKIRCK